MKKLLIFMLAILMIATCFTSCDSKSESDSDLPKGVCKSGDDIYYAIELTGSIHNYFTLSDVENKIAMNHTTVNGQSNNLGVVYYRSEIKGGTLIYRSESGGNVLYLPKGFPESKIQSVASSYAMGFITEYMTFSEAEDYIFNNKKPQEATSKNTANDDSCNHEYTEATCTEKATCVKCGETKGSTLSHQYLNATCTEASTCKICGYSTGSALGHSYSNATCTSPKKCSRCGETDGSELGHNLVEASCTSPKKCSRCSYFEGSALGHNYVNDKCSRCGVQDPDSIPVGLNTVHVIDSSNGYSYETDGFNDSFGYTHTPYHYYYYWCDQYSVHYLNGQYTKFSGSLVASEKMESKCEYSISIFVDDVLKFSKSGLKKTSGKIDFEIDVTGGQQLAIRVDKNYTGNGVAVVNAELKKK